MVEVMSVAASESVRAMAMRSVPIGLSATAIFGQMIKLLTHDISLCANGHQPVDMLADGHQDFAGHVAALLRARRLVLNVNSRGSSLDEQSRQLHDGRQTAVTGVCIRNNGPEVVVVVLLIHFSLGLLRRASRCFRSWKS